MTTVTTVTTDPQEEALLLASIDRFLERDVTPYAHDLEHDDTYPEKIVEQMKALGLFGAIIKEEYGGLGLSTSTYAKIVERISKVWMSLTGIFNSHLIMAAAVQRFGTEEQKRAWLPRFASGELRGGLALTEPDCGTDLQAIRTTAVRDGEHYVINGTKTWISNGIHGKVFALLVKTDPTAEPRHKGTSFFLAEKGAGFTVSRKLEKLGYKGIDSAELVFDNFRVHKDRLIGGEEGWGLRQALGGLELGRINVAARGVGVAAASLSDALASTRRSRSSWPTWPPRSKRRACWWHLPRRPTIAASAATWKRAWPSSSPARRPSTIPWRPCASWVAMATPRNSTWNATIATPR